MQKLKVRKDNGEMLQFTTDEYCYEIILLEVVKDNGGDECIVGYAKDGGCGVYVLKWDLDGYCHGNGSYPSVLLPLTPRDKFADLKRAYNEGAVIEYWSPCSEEWREFPPIWDPTTKYRIKGGIPIEKWDVHKEIIKAWWKGAEVGFWEGYVDHKWTAIDSPSWFESTTYHIKEPQHRKVTMEELETELGYKIKVVGSDKV